MATPDTTIMDLLIDFFNDTDPGGLAAAQAALEADHPQAFADTVTAAVFFATRTQDATSGSSVTVGTGTKVFTLDGSRDWKKDMPVVIVAQTPAAPVDTFMVGRLSADEAAGVLTVEVTTTGGTGTFTAWTLFAMVASSTVVSPPVTEAQGGTDATTFVEARANMELVRRFPLLDLLSTPPGGPGAGDQYLVGDAPTGAWSANEHDIATFNGATWNFTTPDPGDLAYDATEDQSFYLFTGSTQSHGGLWPGSEWVGLRDPKVANSVDFSGDLTILVGEIEEAKIWRFFGASGVQILTLPDPSGWLNSTVRVINQTAFDLTVNAAGAGTLTGEGLSSQASITVGSFLSGVFTSTGAVSVFYSI